MLSRSLNCHRCLILSVLGHIFKNQRRTVFTKRGPDKPLTNTAEVPGCTSVANGAMVKRKAPQGIFTNEPQSKMTDRFTVDSSVYHLQSVVSVDIDMEMEGQSAYQPVSKPSGSLPQDPLDFGANNISDVLKDPMCFIADVHHHGEGLHPTADSPALTNSSLKTPSSNTSTGFDVITSELLLPPFPSVRDSENIAVRQPDKSNVKQSEVNVSEPFPYTNLNSASEGEIEPTFQTENKVGKHLESKKFISTHLKDNKVIEKHLKRENIILPKRKSQVCAKTDTARANFGAGPSKLLRSSIKDTEPNKTTTDSKVTQSMDKKYRKHTAGSMHMEYKSTGFNRGTAYSEDTGHNREGAGHGKNKNTVRESKSQPARKTETQKSSFDAEKPSSRSDVSTSNIGCMAKQSHSVTKLSTHSVRCDKSDKQPIGSKMVLRNKSTKRLLNSTRMAASDSSSVPANKSSKTDCTIVPKETLSASSKSVRVTSKNSERSASRHESTVGSASQSKTAGAKKSYGRSTAKHSAAEQTTASISKARCSAFNPKAVGNPNPKANKAVATADPRTVSSKPKGRDCIKYADSTKRDGLSTSGTKDIVNSRAASANKDKQLCVQKDKVAPIFAEHDMSLENSLSTLDPVLSKDFATCKISRSKTIKYISTKTSVSDHTQPGCAVSLGEKMTSSKCRQDEASTTSKLPSGDTSNSHSRAASSSKPSDIHTSKHSFNILNSRSQASAQLHNLSVIKKKFRPTVLPAKLLKDVEDTVSKNIANVASQVLALEVQSQGSIIENPGKLDVQSESNVTTSGVATMGNKIIDSAVARDDGRLSAANSTVTASETEVNVCSSKVTVGDGEQDATNHDFLSSLPFAETELDSDINGVCDNSPLFSESFDHECIQNKQKTKKVAKKRKKEERRKKKYPLAKKDETPDAEDDKHRKPRPNYFIAVQITNPQIKERLAAIQETILEKNKHLEKIMIKIATIHLTLLVMSLTSEDDMARACLALDKCGYVLKSRYQSKLLQLDVCGLGTFRNQVVFAKVSPGLALQQMETIAESVRQLMDEQSVLLTDNKPFAPHVTIMKMTKANTWFKKNVAKRIEPDLYDDFLTTDFGQQEVTQLQLCSMQRKSKSGYYQVEHVVNFGPHGPHDDDSRETKQTSEKSSISETDLKVQSKEIVEMSIQAAIHQFKRESGETTHKPLDHADEAGTENDVSIVESLSKSNAEIRKVDNCKLQVADRIKALGETMAKSCLEEVFNELKRTQMIKIKGIEDDDEMVKQVE